MKAKAVYGFYSLVAGAVLLLVLGGIEMICSSDAGKGLMRVSYWVSGR